MRPCRRPAPHASTAADDGRSRRLRPRDPPPPAWIGRGVLPPLRPQHSSRQPPQQPQEPAPGPKPD
eukprot:3508049-Pyramimonas_sp.AAC.1